MLKSTFHGDTKDPECQRHKGCPFPRVKMWSGPTFSAFPELEQFLWPGAPRAGTEGGISSLPLTFIWDCWYSLCIQRLCHPLLRYLREWRMRLSRLFQLPADVLSANERLFSTITFPSYPGRGKEGECASSSIPFFSIWFFSLWCYGQAVGNNFGNHY